jgi:hypothetical protein
MVTLDVMMTVNVVVDPEVNERLEKAADDDEFFALERRVRRALAAAGLGTTYVTIQDIRRSARQ